MDFDLDAWLIYYRDLLGYSVSVEYDGTHPAWMVYNEAGELVDWWWLTNADQVREIGDDGKPKPASQL